MNLRNRDVFCFLLNRKCCYKYSILLNGEPDMTTYHSSNERTSGKWDSHNAEHSRRMLVGAFRVTRDSIIFMIDFKWSKAAVSKFVLITQPYIGKNNYHAAPILTYIFIYKYLFINVYKLCMYICRNRNTYWYMCIISALSRTPWNITCIPLSSPLV
jgi:hypothetical protein